MTVWPYPWQNGVRTDWRSQWRNASLQRRHALPAWFAQYLAAMILSLTPRLAFADPASGGDEAAVAHAAGVLIGNDVQTWLSNGRPMIDWDKIEGPSRKPMHRITGASTTRTKRRSIRSTLAVMLESADGFTQ